jgi:malate dehydrogenase (oxaloacetate-decarboxylating)(NADP+)
MGMSKPVHLLSRGAQVEEIVNVTAIAVVDAQETMSLSDAGAKMREEIPVGVSR